MTDSYDSHSGQRLTAIKIKPFTCTTDGSGYWSKVQKETTVTGVSFVTYHNDGISLEYAQLHVAVEGWDMRDGLIYGDNRWLAEFKAQMVAQGYTVTTNANLPSDALDYTEQGMQQENTVSLETHQLSQIISLAGGLPSPTVWMNHETSIIKPWAPKDNSARFQARKNI